MKFATPFFAALALATGQVHALKQFNQRALLDVCAFVDADLVVDVPVVGSTVVGLLDVCLCISALPLFISTNVVAIAAVALVGEPAVLAIITALINAAPGHETCTYPPGSTPICTEANPCGFTCPAGTTPSPPPPAEPTSCVTAPSGIPKKRDVDWWMDVDCRPGWSACAVPGGSKKSWECVNTMADLESCGGCTLPLHLSAPRGQDCTEIPAVSSVSCLSGGCAVHSCIPGWRVSAAGNSCVEEDSRFASSSPASDTMNRIFQAVEYGLEHMPLKK